MALINILKQGDQIHLLDQRDPCREFAFNLGWPFFLTEPDSFLK